MSGPFTVLPLPPLDEVLARAEREYLVELLTATAGGVVEAARVAGRNRQGMYKLLERHGLIPKSFKVVADDGGKAFI